MSQPATGATSREVPFVLTVVAVMLLAVNLRASVNVIGPLLPAIRADLGLSGFQVGLLTALPPICFGLLSMGGARASAGLGPTRLVVLSLVLLIAGQLLRAMGPGLASLFAGTFFALAAVAALNVLMPALIASYFPGRIPTMTAAYTVILALGGAMSSALTLPLQDLFGGGWRLGIGMWAMITAVALIPWLAISRYGPGAMAVRGTHIPVAQLIRSPKAWTIAVFFGLQALQAYVVFSWYPTMLTDAGLDLTSAAGYVGLVSLASMAGSLVLPGILNTMTHTWIPVVAINLAFVLGYAGTWAAATAAPWLWAVLLGIGTTNFPLGLYLVTQKARSGAGVLALSGFMQGIGYIMAAAFLILFGTLQGDSTHWGPMLAALIAITLVQLVAALRSVAPWTIEDDLDAHQH